MNRCLEEGAEDFIVKLVKLSEVNRIKDYMTREFRFGEEKERSRKGINKRKLRDNFDDLSPSPPSISSSSPSLSPPQSQSPTPSPSPSPPSVLSASAPSSPSPLYSPTRHPKMTSSE
ncbi:response regulator 3 [Hibiscus trionum]|uniref:Response regulator 3 n=1 Tax=Hibiscus trionum TaxID=183268 RepID=A0A9W7MID3_HIBTR|nr:response regulator 3 [Hibiscus trionum]